jgi:hypothetical protein
MILNRLQLILARFVPGPGAVASARRWRAARERDPALLPELLMLGGVAQPTGLAAADRTGRMDPCRLAYEAGRRDLALELAALMGVSPDDLSTLMRE